MTLVDPLGDMLTRIRNAQMRSKGKVVTPASSLRGAVLEILKSEGYIRDFLRVDYDSGKADFEIGLKYYNGKSAIRYIQRVSKPGRRVYSAMKNMPRVADGLGVVILSTSQGVMSDHEARGKNVGGEVLCRVF